MVRRAPLLLALVALAAASTVAGRADAAPAIGAPGGLDPSFAGGKGLVEFPFGPGQATTNGMAVQPDGKVIVVGNVNPDGNTFHMDAIVARFTADGRVDTAFGDGGKVVKDFEGGYEGGYDEAFAAAVEPGGTILVAGTATLDDGVHGFVLRLTAAGRLDSSFGSQGIAFLPVGTVVIDMARQSDGKIVLGGSNQPGGAFAARLKPDGAPDGGFGTDGRVSAGQGDFWAYALALQADGRIVVAGSMVGFEPDPTLSSPTAARFTSDGALDTTFGGTGVVHTVLSGPSQYRITTIKDVAIDAKGRIVLAGGDDTQLALAPPGVVVPRFEAVSKDLVLVRYLPDGSLDTSLGGAGHRIVAMPSNSLDSRPTGLWPNENGMAEWETRALAVAIDPQGRLVVAGATSQTNYVPAVMRFTDAGLLDPTFGTGGVSIWSMPYTQHTEPSGGYFSDLTLLPDGRILAGGRTYYGKTFKLVAARFLPSETTTTVSSWGWNGGGQLGDGTIVDQRRPVRVSISDVVAVSAGGIHTLALKGDGTVWAWGWNGVGQLGDGTTVDRWAPKRVPGLSGVVAIAAGSYHSLALKGDGTVWAWGWNAYGQLGDGTTVDRSAPVQVKGSTGMISIAAGGLHSLAAQDGGAVWAWGSNGIGQLGDGTTVDRDEPVNVSDRVYLYQSFVAAGGYHNVSINNTMGTFTWGWNPVGQAGPTPAVPYIQAAGGAYHTLLLRDSGEIWAMGWNGLGQLGDGTTTDRAQPVALPARALRVAAGGFHSLAVALDGSAWAWGWNAVGQLGNGTTADSHLPVRVSGLTGAVGISAGALHSVALTVA